MKKLIFLTGILAFFLSTGFAQNNSDTISVKKVLGGYQFIQNDRPLTIKQLMKTMEVNDEAYKIIKSAKSSYDFSMILGCAGGFCIGYQLGEVIGGGDPNWTMAAVGAGLIAVSVPLSSNFNKKALAAVNTYNQDFKKTSFWNDKELKLSFKSYGLSLKLRF